MIIKKTLDQIRNDIFLLLECEHCGHEQKTVGYNDDNWFNNVLPTRKCDKCGATSKSPP